MTKASQAASQSAENAGTGSPTKPPLAKGFVNPEWLPEGYEQVQPMSSYFQYRGNDYKLTDLKKEDIDRILSYKKNPWFVKKAA